jgi:mono/diheme cytochrome c family protein
MKRYFKLGLVTGLALVGLLLSQVAGASDKTTASVTFTKDVAPIVFKNCASCHRPNQIAPMSFLNYKQVRPWAKSIRDVVLEKTMPPWYADPSHGEFANDRRLSQKEIDTITAWVDQGAREGDPKDLPAPPKFTEGEWAIGKPDVVLPMTEEFAIPADGVVEYKYFAVPTNFTEDKYLTAAEIKRGNPSVVHHVIVNVMEPGMGPLPPAGQIRTGGERFDREGGRSGNQANNQNNNQNNNQANNQQRAGQNRTQNPDGMLIGWAPGMMPLVLLPGQAKLVKKGSVLIFQMHYTTTGEAAKDQTSVGLVFAKTAVEKRVITSGAFARNLLIPAGEGNYESRATFNFKEDSHILNFMPHMHLRGKDFEYKLFYPDGTSKVLLRVPKYNFNWQITYWLKQPVAAPKGSRLECIAHHDNSTKNKYNPDPASEVRWGQQTWDEMMIGWFDYTLDAQDLRPETAGLVRKN